MHLSNCWVLCFALGIVTGFEVLSQWGSHKRSPVPHCSLGSAVFEYDGLSSCWGRELSLCFGRYHWRVQVCMFNMSLSVTLKLSCRSLAAPAAGVSSRAWYLLVCNLGWLHKVIFRWWLSLQQWWNNWQCILYRFRTSHPLCFLNVPCKPPLHHQ